MKQLSDDTFFDDTFFDDTFFDDTMQENAELKPGNWVVVCFDAANRNPEKFPSDQQLGLRRHHFSDRLPLDHGVHFSMGATRAQTEMKIPRHDR